MRMQHSSLIFPPPINSLHHLPSHLANQTQPLHYPSSTPTHFAPGLQRITSPLLLSTTSSLSNARSSSNSSSNLNTMTPVNRENNNVNLSVAQAAGALENMSNELGPSATFKYSSSNKSQGTSLMNNEASLTGDNIKKETKSFSTPSSALNVTSNTMPPKLPALGSNSNGSNKNVSSPSLGHNSICNNPNHNLNLSLNHNHNHNLQLNHNYRSSLRPRPPHHDNNLR